MLYRVGYAFAGGEGRVVDFPTLESAQAAVRELLRDGVVRVYCHKL